MKVATYNSPTGENVRVEILGRGKGPGQYYDIRVLETVRGVDGRIAHAKDDTWSCPSLRLTNFRDE